MYKILKPVLVIIILLTLLLIAVSTYVMINKNAIHHRRNTLIRSI